MKSTNRRCEILSITTDTFERCPDNGWHEYCGYCAAHWLTLRQEDRDILLKQRVDVPPEIHNHVHEVENREIHHPPRSRMLDAVIVAAGMIVGTTLWHLASLGFAVGRVRGWW